MPRPLADFNAFEPPEPPEHPEHPEPTSHPEPADRPDHMDHPGPPATVGLPGRTDPVLGAVRTIWGFDTLRPLQREAIDAAVARRDSLVVLPTGGGKSLCYQVPPLVAGRMDVVVSPLIALMKDQVDGLRANDYPAAALHSAMTDAERRDARSLVERGACRLLFVSPERLLSQGFLDFLARAGVRAVAIDEAHCISHWGHDFRPEYRQLRSIRERLPEASLHAYTATATPRVRDDIVAQLRLRDPALLVGDFHRPNLLYRVVPKTNAETQVLQVLARHAGEAAIVYCISRRETESLATALRQSRIRAAHYHAGMTPDARRETQERFADESLDVIVATIAFGMGIDRSDVRCVVHAGVPKSIEAYQQESGRAGRDGLPAECVLLYGYGDIARWESLMQRSRDEAAALDPEAAPALDENLRVQRAHLADIQRLCAGSRCRHRALCEHFGQRWERAACAACDVCLGEIDAMPDATTVARKILSAVARTGQAFGVGHVVKVLLGSTDEAVRRHGHDRLSVHGLLGALPQAATTNLVHQLLDHGLLARTEGDRPTLFITPAGAEAMRGGVEVALRRPITGRKAKAVKRTEDDARSWAGVERDLFDRLRELRRAVAAARQVPPYVIFDDRTLRELARVRPSDMDRLATIRGVGRRKLEDLGPMFLDAIREHCRAAGLAMDVESGEVAG
ncbi:MAG TPA: ATP-dependent DNA helicase RecQ [Phycisphaerales bacterium]|nr:ATP-dependent DNA helicase RecQ [Phycisphaerales bacterium]HMP37861.1 ATP-dependent DNA helicase RecQ [Phycisphaerales bacterium]